MKDTDLNLTTSIITLNVNGLNITIKTGCQVKKKKKARSNYMLATKKHALLIRIQIG